MSEPLTLTPDELLTTTRAVRKRLDFTRPVERTVLEECLTIARAAKTKRRDKTSIRWGWWTFLA